MGNKELRFLLCKTEQTSTSLSPTPPPAFHSLILTTALMALSGQLSRSARVQQGVFPWNYQLLEIRVKKNNAADQNQGHQQRNWDPSAIQVGWSEVQKNLVSMRRMWSSGERVRPGMCPGTWAIHWICISSSSFPVWLEAGPVIYPASQFSIVNWTLFLRESCADRKVKCINDCLIHISVTRVSQIPGLIH